MGKGRGGGEVAWDKKALPPPPPSPWEGERETDNRAIRVRRGGGRGLKWVGESTS